MEEGYKSIAIICKTSKEAKNVYINLKKVHRKTSVKLIDYNSDEIQQGIIVIPAYMSKGLEFDVVFVFNASCDNYHTELDRRLLYIACTRALHRLVFYCNGKSSIFLNNDSNLKT
jgi:DNA helicase-2/ATP-dependent DNA helicase PcrA